MSCGVMPAYPVVSTCGTCPTCCSTTVQKRSVEKRPICLPWAHRLDCGGVWTLKSVTHVVKQATGASLVFPAWDATKAYAIGDKVSVGAAVYEATAVTTPGQTPWGAGAPWALTADVNADLFVSLDTDRKAVEWIDKSAVSTNAIVEGGVAETDYRVEAMATFRDCEGREVQFWDCVTVKVINCN
jgi:hypothetical protein